jgi:hypothetical protein
MTMLTSKIYKRVTTINLFVSSAAIVFICVFTLLSSCETNKLADECDRCEVDADCKAGLTCEQFGEWWSTLYMCAAPTTEECSL